MQLGTVSVGKIVAMSWRPPILTRDTIILSLVGGDGRGYLLFSSFSMQHTVSADNTQDPSCVPTANETKAGNTIQLWNPSRNVVHDAVSNTFTQGDEKPPDGFPKMIVLDMLVWRRVESEMCWAPFAC